MRKKSKIMDYLFAICIALIIASALIDYFACQGGFVRTLVWYSCVGG